MKPQEVFDVMQPVRGVITLYLKDALPGSPTYGQVIKTIDTKNSPTRGGVAWLCQQMLSGEAISSQVLEQLALGTDTTAPTTSDSALGSEVVRKAVGTWDTAGLTAAVPYFVAQVEFGTGEGNGTLAEVGLFNSSAGGTMLVHGTFGTFAKATSNTLGVSYTVSHAV